MERYLVYILLTLVTTILHRTLASTPKCNGNNEYVYNKCECLKFVYGPQTNWQEAAELCKVKGGQLVTIKDRTKHEFIVDILKRTFTRNGVWIGLRRVSANVYEWVDGEELDYGNSFWDVGEPNPKIGTQNCVVMHRKNTTPWSWKDFVCDVFIAYSRICEYEIPCKNEEKDKSGLTQNEIIGVVVGGVVGLICSLAVIFLLINCCRDIVSRKMGDRREIELREIETESGCDEPQSSHPMIPPPEKATHPVARGNDLDKSSLKRKRGPLESANVVVVNPAAAARAATRPKRQQSVKISNAPAATEQSDNSANDAAERDRASFGSIEDNYLNANTDTGAPKEYTSSVGDINKL